MPTTELEGATGPIVTIQDITVSTATSQGESTPIVTSHCCLIDIETIKAAEKQQVAFQEV